MDNLKMDFTVLSYSNVKLIGHTEYQCVTVIKTMEMFKNYGCTYYSGKYKITTKSVNFKGKVFETTVLINPSNDDTSARYFPHVG